MKNIKYEKTANENIEYGTKKQLWKNIEYENIKIKTYESMKDTECEKI